MTTPLRKRIQIATLRLMYPVSDVTIWRKVKAGTFPAPHYLGYRRFWYADEVEAWIAAQIAREQPTQKPGGTP
jgi:predicted DNA-binding transcriptional regulator AlpA